MTVRHALLAGSAVLVLGATVYLFVEVRSRPAAAEVPARVASAEPAPSAAAEDVDDSNDAPAARAPAPAAPAAPAAPESQRMERRGVSALARGRIERAAEREGGGEVEDAGAKFRSDVIMDEANKAYDRGDIDEARTIAKKVLDKDPNNVRMLRVVTSASCIEGDAADAQKHYALLPVADRAQMKTRCARYGVTFQD